MMIDEKAIADAPQVIDEWAEENGFIVGEVSGIIPVSDEWLNAPKEAAESPNGGGQSYRKLPNGDLLFIGDVVCGGGHIWYVAGFDGDYANLVTGQSEESQIGILPVDKLRKATGADLGGK